MTIAITMPAISPLAKLDELLGAGSPVLAASTVVVECCVRTTSGGGAVDVTRAAVWSDHELLDMDTGWAEPGEVVPQYGQ